MFLAVVWSRSGGGEIYFCLWYLWCVIWLDGFVCCYTLLFTLHDCVSVESSHVIVSTNLEIAFHHHWKVFNLRTHDWQKICIPWSTQASEALIGRIWGGGSRNFGISLIQRQACSQPEQTFSQSISLINIWRMALAFLTNYTEMIAEAMRTLLPPSRRSPGLRLLPPAVHQSSPQALLCARSDLTVPLRPHASTTFSSAVYYRCSAVHGNWFTLGDQKPRVIRLVRNRKDS